MCVLIMAVVPYFSPNLPPDLVVASFASTWIIPLAIDHSPSLLSWVSGYYQDNSWVVIDGKKKVAVHLMVSILVSCFCVFGWSYWIGTT